MVETIYLVIEQAKYSTFTDTSTIVVLTTKDREKAKEVMEQKYNEMRKDFIDFVNATDDNVEETIDMEKLHMEVALNDLYYSLRVEGHFID